MAKPKKEIWKPIFDGSYAVSNLGRVKRVKRGRGCTPGRLRKPVLHRVGYYHVNLWMGNQEYGCIVHRLVAHAFLGPCPVGKNVNHKDGCKTHNWPQNLEYTTPKENSQHAAKTRLIASGERHYKSVISDAEVRDIRSRCKKRGDRAQLAREFGIQPRAVSDIVLMKSRKYA